MRTLSYGSLIRAESKVVSLPRSIASHAACVPQSQPHRVVFEFLYKKAEHPLFWRGNEDEGYQLRCLAEVIDTDANYDSANNWRSADVNDARQFVGERIANFRATVAGGQEDKGEDC